MLNLNTFNKKNTKTNVEANRYVKKIKEINIKSY